MIDKHGRELHPACRGRKNHSYAATASRRNGRTRTRVGGYPELIEVGACKGDTTNTEGKGSRILSCYGLGRTGCPR